MKVILLLLVCIAGTEAIHKKTMPTYKPISKELMEAVRKAGGNPEL
tara:strand:- start:325 stop:462 length:138 start_codon:yes stop_codon:yes gene_type:complete